MSTWGRWMRGRRGSSQEGLEVSDTVKQYLVERARIIACMFWRGWNENYLKFHSLSEATAKRQSVNQWLRDYGLWERLTPSESALMSLPDQGWTDDQVRSHYIWHPQLQLLRWVLGIDANLARVERSLPFERERLVVGMFDTKGLPSSSLIPQSDLETERDLAYHLMARFLGECRSRKLDSDPENAAWLDECGVAADAYSDLRIESKSIGELDDDTVLLMYGLTKARCAYAAFLVDLLEMPEPISFEEWLANQTSPN